MSYLVCLRVKPEELGLRWKSLLPQGKGLNVETLARPKQGASATIPQFGIGACMLFDVKVITAMDSGVVEYVLKLTPEHGLPIRLELSAKQAIAFQTRGLIIEAQDNAWID